jgi:hypothetical protein
MIFLWRVITMDIRSLLDGTFGFTHNYFYTFLPSFLFIDAPFVEKTKGNENLKSILSIITAAVVGVVFEPHHLPRQSGFVSSPR